MASLLRVSMATVATLFLGIGFSEACTAPPTICNAGAGIILPGNSVQEWGGTAGPRTLASDSDPQWNWDPGLSFAYVYASPPNNAQGGTSWLGHDLEFTWSWSQNPLVNTPGSGKSLIVTIHCVVIGNDGEIWYDATDSQIGYYDNGGGNAISCPMEQLDGLGLGPTHWFNHNGQSAHDNSAVANQYAALFGNKNNMFAFGLVFGDNCPPNTFPNWPSGTSDGNATCWVDGAYAGGSHFEVTSANVF